MGFSRSWQGKRRFAALAAALAALVLCLAAVTALAHPFHPGAETADTTAPGLKLDRIGSFDFPVYLTSPRGDRGRQFVVEQDGQIRIIKNGSTLSRPFLDLASSIDFNQGERGLLSMAFAPDYATSGRFYVFYTLRGGNLRVDELRRSSNPDVAARSTRRKVLEIPHRQYANHNGGQLQFGPDGLLYISTGDGGGGGDPLRSGQNKRSLLGKILRVNPRRSSSRGGYSIPSGNPYIGRSGRNEIWHYGLRNPWRFSFDRATGSMAIGDVGQGQREEIDFIGRGRKGMNFGWRCWEGTLRYATNCTASRHVPPAVEYSHVGERNASCSVTGGYVVRDPSLPRLRGRYVYGDYCTGALHAAILRDGRRTPASENDVMDLIVPRLTSFGEDAQGRLYATSRSYEDRPGAVYRLRATP